MKTIKRDIPTTISGEPMLKPMSKRRMVKKFKKYGNDLDQIINKQNIESRDHIQSVMSYAASYSAGMKPKQSKIFVENSISVFRDIIAGRFNSDNDHEDSCFFREWTKNCRGEEWFAYCRKKLRQSMFNRKTIMIENGKKFRIIYSKVIPETKPEKIINIDGEIYEVIFKLEIRPSEEEFVKKWLAMDDRKVS